MIPGEYILDGPDLELNPGRPVVTLSVTNTGDRPVQIGAHYHFFEVNRALVFDRVRAYGMRLDLPSGTSVRFEPGDTKEVKLIAYGGRRTVYGFNGLVNGRLDDPYNRAQSLKRMADQGYGHKPADDKKTK
jgi:urease beta subunit